MYMYTIVGLLSFISSKHHQLQAHCSKICVDLDSSILLKDLILLEYYKSFNSKKFDDACAFLVISF